MSKKLTWQEHFKFWLTKEGYDELINNYGIDELIRHTEIEIVMPLTNEIEKLRKELDGMYSLNKEGWTKVEYYEKLYNELIKK